MEKVEVDIVSVNIKPLEDRLVVKPLEAEQTTASGLVIPDTAKEKPRRARSRSVPVASTTTATVSRSTSRSATRWIYSKYGGTEVKYSGEEYLILSARDVLAVVSSIFPGSCA